MEDKKRIFDPKSLDTRLEVARMYNIGTPVKLMADWYGVSKEKMSEMVKSMLDDKEIVPRKLPKGGIKESGKKKKDEEDEPDDPVMEQTEGKYKSKASEYLSGVLLGDLKLSLTGAKMLRRVEMIYRPDVEAMGLDWWEFVEKAIQEMYGVAIEKWKEKRNDMDMEDIAELQAQTEMVRKMGELNGK